MIYYFRKQKTNKTEIDNWNFYPVISGKAHEGSVKKAVEHASIKEYNESYLQESSVFSHA